MTTEQSQIRVSGLPVDMIRKDIKHLHLAVYPPHGRIRVAVPLRLNEEDVRLAVVSRLGWIRRQRLRFHAQDRQSAREYVTGESHYFRGRRYRLRVREGDSARVVVGNSTLDLYGRKDLGPEQRAEVVRDWYRAELRGILPGLLDKWSAAIGVRPSYAGIRRMKTMWGTCNGDAGRIWLNLELAKKPLSSLEYVLVHELVHLLERRHTETFQDLMNDFMPQWKLRRDELNGAPLAHEDWTY